MKVAEPTLRELLIAQSIFTCKTTSEVSEIVKDQPSALIFNKVFLELEMRSLLSYLAFDRRSISTILQKSISMATEATFKEAFAASTPERDYMQKFISS